MDALRFPSERDSRIIVQEVLKAMPKDTQDCFGKRKVPRHRQRGRANRMRQLAGCEPVSAGGLALDDEPGGHLGKEGEAFLRVGLEPAALELELDLGNRLASPGSLDRSVIERSPRDRRVGRELMRDPAKSSAKPRLERRA